MKRIRQDIRLSQNEKNLLIKWAQEQGMTVTDYIKHKLFDRNTDFINDEYIFECPSGERYNYSIAGLSMLNHLVLKSLTEKLYGDQSVAIINDSIKESKSKLEQLYGYRKIKVKTDE